MEKLTQAVFTANVAANLELKVKVEPTNNGTPHYTLCDYSRENPVGSVAIVYRGDSVEHALISLEDYVAEILDELSRKLNTLDDVTLRVFNDTRGRLIVSIRPTNGLASTEVEVTQHLKQRIPHLPSPVKTLPIGDYHNNNSCLIKLHADIMESFKY